MVPVQTLITPLKLLRRNHLPGIVLFFLVSSALSDTIPGIPAIKQEYTNWCWAAVCQSIVGYYDPDFHKTQTEVANVLTTENIAPDPADLITCLEENGKDVSLHAQMVMGALSWQTMKKEADENRPFYFLIRWQNGDYHSNVFCGYIGDSTRLKFMDPDNGSFVIRTYNASLSIYHGIGTWERSILTRAATSPIINDMRPPGRNSAFEIVRENHGYGGCRITVIAPNAARHGTILKIYTASGFYVYETPLAGYQTEVTWGNRTIIPAGRYIATVMEHDGPGQHPVASHLFSIVK